MTPTQRPAASRRFHFDRTSRRVGGGRVLIGGSPLVLFRLTDSGSLLLDQIDRGDGIVPTGSAARLIDRLLDAGVIHPAPAVVNTSGMSAMDVTVVIPAFGAATDTLAALVAQCHGTDAVIIVDDASPTPVPPIHGATVVRHLDNRGPGAARATGAALATTALIAFVDSDVVLDHGWLVPLFVHFDDDRVGLVSPRVASAAGPSLIERYETQRSPLDLGGQEARIRAGTRVSYVPAAAIVVRSEALKAVGGFDESMRVGEDVDLVWRLDEAGYRLRYEPASTVHHAARPNIRKWARQRFDYGSSAATLARRHPNALAPLRVSGWSATAWATAIGGWPLFGGSIAALTTALLARKLRDVPDGPREALRLAGLGHLYAGRSLAAAMTRAWWPACLLAALISKRCRRALLIAAVVPAGVDWVKMRPSINPAAYIGLRVADDATYGWGVVSGALAERSLAALRPDFTSWPGRRSANAG